MSNELILQWEASNQSFHPVAEVGTKGIFLELLEDEKVWFFKYSDKDISFIQRRTALRRAREISKVGMVNPATGARIGVGFECKEENDPYQHLPAKVTRGEHEYNK